MSYLALYRKYRPTTFDGLIGQEHIVKTLSNQIENDRLGHAYLFTGTRGTGKTSAAKIFAKAINCLHPENGSPCGKCEACLALSDPSNIDVIEIDAASNNGVNEIRELREKVQYPPVSCKYKVYIIDEVHMLTGAAFNALLKTLEEPPKHAVFILATTEAHKIPATILSRCMRFDFRLIATERIAELIAKIYDEQGKQYEKEAVFAIAKAGEGSIRDALSIADIALSYGEGKLKYDDVTEILGASGFELVYEFTKELLNGNTGKILENIDKLASLGKSMGVLTKDITSMLRDLLVVKTCTEANKILGLPVSSFIELKKIAEDTNEERLLRAMQIFTEAETSLKYTTLPRTLFEAAAVKAARPETDYNIDALMARIKTLEEAVKNGAVTASVKKTKEVESKLCVQTVNDTETDTEKTIKVKICDSDAQTVKGKLLSGLRRCGSEMLWNVMQSVNIEVRNNTVYVYPSNTGDYELLSIEANKLKIKEALSEFEIFDLQVVEPKSEKQLGEIDDATEQLKKIFGEDIVIVKE